MQKAFLAGAPMVFDPRVKVIAPSTAENPMQVPVTVDATALPGIVLQLAVVPSIVYYLMRAGLIPQRYPR